MKRIPAILLTIALLIGLIPVSSCISDDITTSPTARLEFSRDTVSFDTIFTDEGTPTARLLVYNRNKQGVNISSIRFADPQSRFSINVDGTSGTEFRDIEIRGNDSIYVFIECLLPEAPDSEPYLSEDKLEFVTNGNTQEVVVEAYGQNVTRLHNVELTSDATLTAQQPYVVYDSLVVAPGVRLTIEPGARILFHDKARLVVRGSLDATGEPGKLIQFRGDRLDNVLPDLNYDVLTAQWGGITFRPESFSNRLSYVDVRSSQYGVVADSTGNSEQLKLLIHNSWLHNAAGNTLTAKHCRIEAYGSCFSEAKESAVSVTGGKARLVQCTLANNYLFSAVGGSLLSLQHLFPEDLNECNLPLLEAEVVNCILYSKMCGEIYPGDLTGSSVYLRNCLLGADGTDDANFIECLWGEDPLFLTVREDYYFNYRLGAESPAINAGNPAFLSEMCATDMYGLSRYLSPRPDMGAYVFSTSYLEN